MGKFASETWKIVLLWDWLIWEMDSYFMTILVNCSLDII